MKIFLFLLSLSLAGCSAQNVSDSSTDQLEKLVDYQPKPEEVVVECKVVRSVSEGSVWFNEIEVIKQWKTGFGHKNVLPKGEKIELQSKAELSIEEHLLIIKLQERFNNTAIYVLKGQLNK